MWQPEGCLVLQGVTAPPYWLVFCHFIRICMGKVFNLYIMYIFLLLLYLLIFFLVIFSRDIELNPSIDL